MTEARVVERFKKRTIYFHWVHTAAFLVLLITGAILFFPGLGGLTSGGATRLIHRIAVVVFVAAPLAYFAFNPKMSLHFIKETLTWSKDDIKWLGKAPDYYFGGAEDKMPPQGHVNTGQKMWQVVVLLTGALFLITGLFMWFFKDTLASGVFQWCLLIHDIAFILAITMLFVHVYLSFIHPRMTESLRSMLDGKISVKYAKHHYGKWYDEVSAADEEQ
ncbi:formate dehydrogenase subunit gamma [Chloroflexota bacterium]